MNSTKITDNIIQENEVEEDDPSQREQSNNGNRNKRLKKKVSFNIVSIQDYQQSKTKQESITKKNPLLNSTSKTINDDKLLVPNDLKPINIKISSSQITDSIRDKLCLFGYKNFTDWSYVLPSERGERTFMFCQKSCDGFKEENVTLKIFKTFLMGEQENMENERKIYKYLDDVERIQPFRIKNLQGHVNILKYFDYLCLIPQPSTAMMYALVLETCRENFSSVLKRRSLITEMEKICWSKQIIFGLEYLHALMIVHHDLKPANIFVSFKNECKISDFDNAKIMTRQQEKDDFVYEYTVSNTLSFTFFPPDYLTNYIVTFNFDVWSLAAIIYNLFSSDSAVNLKKIVPMIDLKCVVYLEDYRLDEFLVHQNALKRLLLRGLSYYYYDRCSLEEFKKTFFKIKKNDM